MNLIKKLSKNVKLDCSCPVKIRELYVHEDELINHRMTWLGVTQTLLFAAYGVAIQEKSEPHCATNNIDQLLKLIIYIGGFTSFFILLGILGAIIASLVIKTECKLNQLGITNFTTYMGWICAAGIPIVFICAWLSLL